MPNLKVVIADVTLDPLSVRQLWRAVPNDVVLIFIDSLTKYAQCGLNMAVGGMAGVMCAKGNTLGKRLAVQLERMPVWLGQHMDPRLALALIPSRTLFVERLRRMRRNARLIAQWFERIAPGSVRHAADREAASTLVYIRGRIRWAVVPADSDLYQFRRMRKGRRRTEAFLRSFEHDYLRPWDERDEGPSVVRVSTSFGFSITSMHGIADPSDPDGFWLRISAGVESLEQLHVVLSHYVSSWLPFFSETWEDWGSPGLDLLAEEKGLFRQTGKHCHRR